MYSLVKNSFILVALVSLVFSLSACSKTAIVTKEVMIPVKCQAEIPQRPKKVRIVSHNVANIIEYTEKLEALVEMCVEKR